MKDNEKFLQTIEKSNPYAAEYFRKYGMNSGLVFNRGRTESERIYKECLEKGVRWEDILGETDSDMFY